MMKNYFSVKDEKEKEFEEIYRKYAPQILRYILVRADSLQEAEDIVSDTFLKVWNSFSGSLEIKNIRAYLYRAAKNSLVDLYRSKDKRNVEISEEMKEALSDGNDVFQEIGNQQEIFSVIKTIRKLNENYQEVLLLHFVEDMPFSEIAEILGISEGNVRVRLHRGINEMKKIIKS